MLNNHHSQPGILWNHHLIPNNLPEHATIAGSQLGEIQGAMYLGVQPVKPIGGLPYVIPC